MKTQLHHLRNMVRNSSRQIKKPYFTRPYRKRKHIIVCGRRLDTIYFIVWHYVTQLSYDSFIFFLSWVSPCSHIITTKIRCRPDQLRNIVGKDCNQVLHTATTFGQTFRCSTSAIQTISNVSSAPLLLSWHFQSRGKMAQSLAR